MATYWLSLAIWASLLPQAHALSPRLPASGQAELLPHTIPSSQTSTLNQVGRLVNVRVIDRATGTALPIYEHQGEYWVVGSAGSNYAISMQKRASQGRTLAVTSVDGINVISGQTAAYLQTGYVLSGYGAYEITGWRKSLQEVAAFTFSAPGESYASKTGRAANIGVIGVALFVEQRERVLKRPEFEKSEASRDVARSPASGAASSTPPAQSASKESTPRAVPAPLPLGAQSRQDMSNESQAGESKKGADTKSADMSARAQSAISPGLGTQHGQREVSVTQNVAFRRASDTPDEILMIRYDSVENMVRRGVLAYAQPWPSYPPTAMPFPRSVGFVADPPRH